MPRSSHSKPAAIAVLSASSGNRKWVSKMAKAIYGLAVTLALLALPARAQEDVPSSSGELAVEGVGKLIQALEIFIQTIPQFGAPYIDDSGNIVIPRVESPATPDDPAVETGGTIDATT